MSRFVIIGAGECGTRAAFALRENGFDGEIVLVGAEVHMPYERPPLSKSAPVELKAITSAEALQNENIVLAKGVSANAIDRAAKTVSLSDGRRLNYDRLLLATGARARLPSCFGDASTLRTFEDSKAIIGALTPGKKLVIIGGGFIGLELAATARSVGSQVIILEMADRLMARAVPAEIAAVMKDRHCAEGVDIRLGAKILRADALSVELEDGSKLDADLVIAGVGAEPVTDLALSAGLAVENGIVVDHCLATSDKYIFAAGDCCLFPYRGRNVRLESWRAAQDQANHAAKAMLGDETPYGIIPWFWSDQYDLTLQIVGLSEPGTTKIRRPVCDGGFILFEIAGNGTLVAASGVGPGNAVAKDIRLAEMIIAAEGRPSPEALADPAINLKKVLRTVNAAA
ncbi:MAG TPA: FAD-dependent oxidoreductase [Hyphomicrobiales bacterium]|nr:FAD-dependent oxidoreductase [Hyphomicrobiales bacterium]